MLRYLPLLLAAGAIAVAASWDITLNADISGQAEAWAKVLEEDVPSEFGPWVGTDTPTDDTTRTAAGATGYVSRRYKHAETGQVVDLWLIVGHMQGVSRHSPTVCYPAAGFQKQEKKHRYTFNVAGQPESTFWTSWFQRNSLDNGLQRRRVFWAWTLPREGEPVAWQAPSEARLAFPGAQALFKMYFTTDEPDDDSSLEENPANDLAELLLPLVADLLEKGIDSDAAAPTSTTEPTDEDASEADEAA